MNTLEFLQRILPSKGIYCAFLGNRKRNEFFDTVESLSEYITKQDRRGSNVYHAIATFKEDGRRSKNNAAYTRVLTLDIDAKGTDKCYNSVQDAAQALNKFLKVSKLPPPMIIYSGNGLHVYWVLDRELDPDEWNPLNNGLRELTLQHKLRIDPAPSKNGMSLVLRPLGTHNPKGGREVTLVRDAPVVPMTTMVSLLITEEVAKQAQHTKRTGTSKLLDSLAVQSDLPPADSMVLQVKCKQIRAMVDERATLSEPEWYHMLGIAAYCEDAEQTALRWSEDHPDFDPATVVRKMYQWKERTTGPATCMSLESIRPNGCTGCPHKGIITSPCVLGSVPKEKSLDDAVSPVAKQVQLPKPFSRTEKGIFVTVNDVPSQVCPFDIYPVGYGRDEGLGYEVVRYHWNRPHKGWQELKFRQAYLVDGSKEFAGAIADQGIVLKTKTQTGYFQLMLRSYMDELRKMRGMSNLYATMGWKENFTQFLIGNTLITQNGEEEISLAAIGEHTTNLYSTKGKLEDAVRFTSLIDRVDLPWIGNGLLFALATPLFEFTGLRGMTMSLYGQTGSGKTLTQLWQQSLYGDPNKLHGTAKFTQNALFSRMATVRNLPVTVDEATLMQDRDVGEFIMWTTQGRDKARLDRNSMEREVREWFTTVTVSTNRSMTSLLLDGNMESNAQLARVLEVQVHRHKIFDHSTEAGRQIFEFVTTNYGTIGRAYLNRLTAMGEAGIRAAIADAKKQFHKTFGGTVKFSGDERFWENALVLMYVAGTIAKQENLLAFDHKRTIEWQLKQMFAIRREIKSIKKNSLDYLSDYLNEFNTNAVTLWYVKGNTHKPISDVPMDVYRNGVLIRFELYKPTSTKPPNSGIVMFDKAHFRKWLTTKGGDYREFVADMISLNVMAYEEGRRSYLSKHTKVRTGQVRTLGLNLDTPPLQFLIENREAEAELKLASVAE